MKYLLLLILPFTINAKWSSYDLAIYYELQSEIDGLVEKIEHIQQVIHTLNEEHMRLQKRLGDKQRIMKKIKLEHKYEKKEKSAYKGCRR